MIYAVIDTNVFVSALFTKNPLSPPRQVFDAIFEDKIKPLYHKNIIDEYYNVLHRSKFNFSEEKIKTVLSAIKIYGIEVIPTPTGEILVDMDDLIFYEVAMQKRDINSYLVTGNKKHFPEKDFIVTPATMVKILQQ